MPIGFYEKCSLFYDEYLELIAFGNNHDIPVFFTIISDHYRRLAFWQKHQKIYASQWDNLPASRIEEIDSPDHIVSMRTFRLLPIKFARIMCATEYGQAIDLALYDRLAKFYDRPIGISHHGSIIDDLQTMIASGLDLPTIEKHFYMGDQISFDGCIYRDCSHAATPQIFEKLAKIYKG